MACSEINFRIIGLSRAWIFLPFFCGVKNEPYGHRGIGVVVIYSIPVFFLSLTVGTLSYKSLSNFSLWPWTSRKLNRRYRPISDSLATRLPVCLLSATTRIQSRQETTQGSTNTGLSRLPKITAVTVRTRTIKRSESDDPEVTHRAWDDYNIPRRDLSKISARVRPKLQTCAG